MGAQGGFGLRVGGVEIDMNPVSAQIEVMGGKREDVAGGGLDRGDHAPVGCCVHGRRMRSGRSARKSCQSNLREGARTVASPINTFLPFTRQRQSSCTRRLPWSMPITSTSAWTMSPGRTGARNFRVWPM